MGQVDQPEIVKKEAVETVENVSPGETVWVIAEAVRPNPGGIGRLVPRSTISRSPDGYHTVEVKLTESGWEFSTPLYLM